MVGGFCVGGDGRDFNTNHCNDILVINLVDQPHLVDQLISTFDMIFRDCVEENEVSQQNLT